MQQKNRIPFSNFTFENWQKIIILSIIVFYTVWMSFAVSKDTIQSGFSGDYLAFWSAGKVADEKGYARIYDLENLRKVQLKELAKLDLNEKLDASSYAPLPVALFPFFVFPFQILSKINIQASYWIWTSINSIVLIGYLFYFLQKISPDKLDKARKIRILLLMLISYPVWMNFVEGQVEVLLVICAGEFIRQAINKRQFLSGLWLGGFLLKPQMLILIVPILLFMRCWKAVLGLFLSSTFILLTSLILAGPNGILEMIKMWTSFSAGMATNHPEAMINWRMIGLNLNHLFNTSAGWVIAGLGMVMTLVIVFMMIPKKVSYGSTNWVMSMAAVFSASLAITWHSHYHMAVVLIPFLIYLSQQKMFPYRTIFMWATITNLLFLTFISISIVILLATQKAVLGLEYVVAISGFCLNILILISSLRYLHPTQKASELPFVNSPEY